MISYTQLWKLKKAELVSLVIKETAGAIKDHHHASRFFKDFSGLIQDWYKEHFIVLCLNNTNCVIHAELVSMGHLSAALVHQREVFKNVVSVHGTKSIIIGHNHPSGDPTPSDKDHEVTEIIKNAGNLLDIPLLDHIIFTQLGKFYSCKENGRI